jgi:hypothetical protein
LLPWQYSSKQQGERLLCKNPESAGNYCKEFVDRLLKMATSIDAAKIILILEIGGHSDCPVEIIRLLMTLK